VSEGTAVGAAPRLKLWVVEYEHMEVVAAESQAEAEDLADRAMRTDISPIDLRGGAREIKTERGIPAEWANEIPLGLEYGQMTCAELLAAGMVESPPPKRTEVDVGPYWDRQVGRAADPELCGATVMNIWPIDCPECNGPLALLWWTWAEEGFAVLVCSTLSCGSVFHEGPAAAPGGRPPDELVLPLTNPRKWGLRVEEYLDRE